MNFVDFKYNYWNVLIKHISRFHPLSLELIEKYKYLLDWRMLSSNPNIVWNSNFIQKHENKFIWHLLAQNSSLEITTEFIRKYKIRLDWNNLARNPNLPTDDNFIEEFKNQYKIEESHSNISQDFKDKYSRYIIPKQPVAPIPNGIEECSLENFGENYEKWNYNVYSQIYDRIIKPNLKNKSFEAILSDEIPQPDDYIYMTPSRTDQYGLIPSFDPSNNIEKLDKSIETQIVEFNQSKLQEGKDRLYSIVKTTPQPYPCLLMSETFLEHLQNFNLPNFKAFQAVLNTNKFGVVNNYNFIIFENNSIIKECYKEHEFEFYFKRFSAVTPKKTIKGNSEEFNDLLIEVSKKYSQSTSSIIQFYPKKVDVKSNYDIYTLNREIIISKRLGESIMSAGLGPIELKSTYPMTLSSGIETTSTVELINSPDNKILIEKNNFYHKKKERLEKHDPSFKRFKLYNNRLSKIESKLNVIFPPEFITFYLKSKLLYKDDFTIEEFNWLPLEAISIENSYSNRYPETFKSCLVAGNGCGDYVGLLLKKNNDYKLDSEFIVFKHETGEIEKGKIQITIDKTPE